MGGKPLNRPVNGIASTPDGRGYWLISSDGGVFAFGEARFFGSLSGAHVLAPIIGIASTGDGKGYWLLSDQGEAFAFGDALASGAPPALQAPTDAYVGIARIPGTARGIVLTTWDGMRTVFDPGKSGCRSSYSPITVMNTAVVGIATAAGCGVRLAGADGGVFTFGAPFRGSAASLRLNAEIVGIAS